MRYIKQSMSNYNLHVIETDKFKTITIKVNFKRKLKKDEITKRNLLVDALLEGTKNYPSKRLLEIRTEDLYDVGYRIMNYASGNCTVMSFEVGFINEKYTEKGMNSESLKFLSELIYSINIEKDSISYKNFTLARNIINDYLDTLKENTNVYSQIRMLEEMDEPYISYRTSGYKEDLKNITPEELYEYYLDMINNDIVDIFVIGDITLDDAKELIDRYLHIKSNNKQILKHYYEHDKIDDSVKYTKESIDKEQSTLTVGLKIESCSDFEHRYVSSIYNYILGGSTESNLFQTVREENSLCYYITSSIQPLLNIGIIKSGINASDYDETIGFIYQELENMKKGMFDESKIENAKITYINSLTELEDNPESIINMYEGIEYLGSDTIDSRKEKIMQVTKKDIMSFASKIHLNVIYLLEGNGIDE